MDEGAYLSSQEVYDLVLSILEAVEAAEEGERVRDSWADEMRDWAAMLLGRIHEERRDN